MPKKAARKPKKAKPRSRAPAKKAAAPPRARPARAAAPVLRPVPLYEFIAGDLIGYVRLSDPERGIEFSRAQSGKTLPGPSKEVLSLRHYLASGQGGLLVPREEAACKGKIEKQGLAFRYDKVRDWPLTATAQYELLSEGGVDAAFQFSFSHKLNGFEAGVETFMSRARPAVYLHCEGRWQRAVPGPHVQRFYARNQQVAELIADGRWNGLRMAGIALAREPQGYDYPVVILRDELTRWALTYMGLTEQCSSVWVNGAHRTIGFGLIGADVKANSKLTCRLRVLLCRAEKLDDVLPYYRSFVQEARTSRKR